MENRNLGSWHNLNELGEVSGYQGIRVALMAKMPAILGVLIGDFLPEKGGTFSLFLCLIKRLVLVQHGIFVKNWLWAKKRAYFSGFEPVRPVSVKAILYIF